MFTKEKEEPVTVENMALKQKREEYALEIRKQKTEIILNAKRLNLAKNSKKNHDLVESAEGKLSRQTKFAKMKEHGQLLKSALELNDTEKIHQQIQQLREVISYDEEIPFDEFISLGLKAPIQSIIDNYNDYDKLVVESLWIFTNITFVSNERLKQLVDADFCKSIFKCILHNNMAVLEHALWVLANIASDSDEFTLMLCELGITSMIDQLLKVRMQYSDKILGNLSWLISNLMRSSMLDKLFPLLYVIPNLMRTNVDAIILDCLNAYIYVTLSEAHIKKVVETYKPLPMNVVRYLDHNIAHIKFAAMRVIGNLLTVTPCPYLPIMEEAGLFPKLAELLKNRKPMIRKEASWVLSNILGEDANMLDRILSTQVFTNTIRLVFQDVPSVVTECVYCIFNAIRSCTLNQLKRLEDMKVVQAIFHCFTSDDTNVLLNALMCYEALLEKGELLMEEESLNGNPYVLELEKENSLKTFEQLQKHKSKHVFEKTAAIIDKYFAEFTNSS